MNRDERMEALRQAALEFEPKPHCLAHDRYEISCEDCKDLLMVVAYLDWQKGRLHSVVAQAGGYHWRDGVYFRRSVIDEGTVDITVPDFDNLSKLQVLSIPPTEWASIVAAVSAQGETGETYAQALALHNRAQP